MPMATFGGGGGAAGLQLPETDQQRRLRELQQQLGSALGGRQAANTRRTQGTGGAGGARGGTNVGQAPAPPVVHSGQSKVGVVEGKKPIFGALIAGLAGGGAGLAATALKGAGAVTGAAATSASAAAGAGASALEGLGAATPALSQATILEGLGPKLAGLQSAVNNPLTQAPTVMQRLSAGGGAAQAELLEKLRKMFSGGR